VTVETPTRRSPLAAYEDAFADLPEGLRIEELAFLGQYSLRTDPAGDAADAVQRALGCRLPEPCTGTRSADAEVLWLGPDEYLVLTAPDSTQALRLRAEIGEGSASVINVSAQRTTLLLDGRLTRELLARGCALDLDPGVSPAGTCVQTLLAQTGVVMLVDGPDRVRLLVRSSFAAYLADWLIDACAEYREPVT
jgi:sarcosine oxidase subunit gamma